MITKRMSCSGSVHAISFTKITIDPNMESLVGVFVYGAFKVPIDFCLVLDWSSGRRFLIEDIEHTDGFSIPSGS